MGEKHDIITEAERIGRQAEYTAEVEEVKGSIETCADDVCRVSGLERNWAKLGGYYAAATFKQEEKRVSSPLDIIGPTGTGKSQIAAILARYCCEAAIINAKGLTFPWVRDRIIQALSEGKKTIVIEEMDRCLHSEKLEEFVFSSYDRITSKGGIKIQYPGAVGVYWRDKPIDTFTPYVLHRRRHLFDSANANRGIEIYTHRIKDASFPEAEKVISHNVGKMSKIRQLKPPSLDSRPEGIEGRVWSNWEMMLQIATAIGDVEWILWAIERMREDSARLQDGRTYEPEIAVFGAVIAKLERKPNGDYKSVPISKISEVVRREYDLDMSNKEVAANLRGLGMEVRISGGITNLFPDKDRIKSIADRLGLENDFLGDIDGECRAKIPDM